LPFEFPPERSFSLSPAGSDCIRTEAPAFCSTRFRHPKTR
jgi:hypothetical protein